LIGLYSHSGELYFFYRDMDMFVGVVFNILFLLGWDNWVPITSKLKSLESQSRVDPGAMLGDRARDRGASLQIAVCTVKRHTIFTFI